MRPRKRRADIPSQTRQLNALYVLWQSEIIVMSNIVHVVKPPVHRFYGELKGFLDPEDTLIEVQLLFQCRLDCLCLPPAMTLSLENSVFNTPIPLLDRLHDDLRLVRRHNRINGALQNLRLLSVTTTRKQRSTHQKRGCNLVRMEDRRARFVYFGYLLKRASDELLSIVRLKLVRLLRERAQVGDAEEGRCSCERVRLETDDRQCCVAAGRATTNDAALGVDERVRLGGELLHRASTVLYVDDAPLAFQSLSRRIS